MRKFTIVKPAQENDKDVAQFKARELQAKKRAEARAARMVQASKNGLTVSYDKGTNKSPIAKALADALK